MNTSAEAPRSPSKAKKILRRTLSGGALVAAVAGILWWNHHSGSGRPILHVAFVVLLGAVWELGRMGSLAQRDLLPALLAAAAGVLALTEAAIRGHELAASLSADVPRDALAVYQPNLLHEMAWAGGIALVAFCFQRSLARLLPSRSLSRGITYALVGAVIVFVVNDTAAVTASLVPGWIALGVLAVFSLPLVLARRADARSLALVVALAIWLVPPIPALWSLWIQWGTKGLIALLLLSKIGDTAGYYVGTAFGRHHPFPRISPGKTVEGCVGSFAAGTAAGAAAVAGGLLPGSLLGGLAAGAVLNVAAQCGDLLESWVKRKAGVKDSSTVFGPSGGVLDQLDSLLLAVPMAVVTWPFLLRAQGS